MTPPKKQPAKKAPSKQPAKAVPRRGRATPGKVEPTPPPKTGRTAVSSAEPSNVVQFSREKKPRSTGAKTSAKTIEVAERRARAVALKKNGASLAQIAQTIREAYRLTSYDDKAAWADVRAGIERVRVENVMEYVEEQNARLDSWLLKVSTMIADGDLEAINVALRIEKRRADLLGLDAARRIQISGTDGGPIEFIAGESTENAYEAALAALNDVLGPPRELP